MNPERYKTIANLNTDFDVPNIKQHIPSPTETDYRIGYIVRYFIQKANDINAPIHEVDEYGFTNFQNNPFYVVTVMDWRISGQNDQIRQSNAASIRVASKQIRNLSLYLPYLLQFHQK